MELTGALSNVQNLRELARLAKEKRRLIQEVSGQRYRLRQLPPRPQPLLPTIVGVLETAGEPLPVHLIHEEVEAWLGVPVSYRSLKHCLSAHSHGADPRVVRERWGWYRSLRQ